MAANDAYDAGMIPQPGPAAAPVYDPPPFFAGMADSMQQAGRSAPTVLTPERQAWVDAHVPYTLGSLTHLANGIAGGIGAISAGANYLIDEGGNRLAHLVGLPGAEDGSFGRNLLGTVNMAMLHGMTVGAPMTPNRLLPVANEPVGVNPEILARTEGLAQTLASHPAARWGPYEGRFGSEPTVVETPRSEPVVEAYNPDNFIFLPPKYDTNTVSNGSSGRRDDWAGPTLNASSVPGADGAVYQVPDHVIQLPAVRASAVPPEGANNNSDMGSYPVRPAWVADRVMRDASNAGAVGQGGSPHIYAMPGRGGPGVVDYQARWGNDPRAVVFLTHDPAASTVSISDVYRGDGKNGHASDLLASVMRQVGADRPAAIKITNVINGDTLDQLQSGMPPEQTVLGKTLARTIESLGGKPGPFVAVGGAKPSIEVPVSYPLH